jgi:serine phosphatase RsbU (regulator of sigma subunit)
MPILTSVDASVVKKQFKIHDRPVVIGRHPECDVVIDDVSVSRRHAQILKQSGGYFIEDMSSRNGTMVNNNEIHRRTKLFDGSEIKICDVMFTFHLASEPGYEKPRQTVTEKESSLGGMRPGTLLLDEHDNSTIMSQMQIPSSHHESVVGKVSPEEKLKALVQITQALSAGVECDSILQSTLDCIFELFVEADRGFIAFREEDGTITPSTLKVRSTNDEQIRLSRTIVNKVMDSKQAILSSDAAEDSRFDLSQSIADFRIRSMMCAPILNANDESIGVIQLDTLRRSIAFQEEDLEILVTVAMQVGLALQRLEFFEEVKKSAQVQKDLELAHEVQQGFLPQGDPDVAGYDFYAYYRAAERVGGDYYDYIELDDGKIAIIVADVVGHGIAAALLMAKLSGETRFALASNADPVAAFNRINRNLSNMNLDKFVTAVMGLFDTRTNQVTFVSAGHMPPVLRRASGAIEELQIEGAGLPLGILDDTEYGASTFDISEGDVFLLYTDGVNESMNADGQILRTEGILDELKQSQAKTPEAIGNVVYNTVKRFVNGGPQHDDICFVCIGK